MAHVGREKNFVARTGGPTRLKDHFVSPFVQRREEMAYPVSMKTILRCSHAVCTLWYPPTSPCPTPFSSRRTYLPRTLPEVMSEAESSMVQMQRRFDKATPKNWSALHWNCVHRGFLGVHLWVVPASDCSDNNFVLNLLEYKNYAFALEKGEFPIMVMGLSCGRHLR